MPASDLVPILIAGLVAASVVVLAITAVLNYRRNNGPRN